MAFVDGAKIAETPKRCSRFLINPFPRSQ